LPEERERERGENDERGRHENGDERTKSTGTFRKFERKFGKVENRFGVEDGELCQVLELRPKEGVLQVGNIAL
jgi:hypothetical protein